MVSDAAVLLFTLMHAAPLVHHYCIEMIPTLGLPRVRLLAVAQAGCLNDSRK